MESKQKTKFHDKQEIQKDLLWLMRWVIEDKPREFKTSLSVLQDKVESGVYTE